MSGLISIGVTGLQAQQAKLSTAGHNIANASTPGYSRQRVDQVTQPAQFVGVGFLGNGTRLEAISRVADEFITNQIRLDSSVFQEVSTYLDQVSQMDTLLADELTGLQPAMQAFFGSLQVLSTDPTSQAARQLVLNETDFLVDRFNSLDDRLTLQQSNLTGLIQASANKINQYADGIADLNRRIASLQGGGAAQPNDLLDQRDELLRQLSEVVGIKVVAQDNGQLNVFTGKGQAIVLGTVANQLALTSDGEITLKSDSSAIPQVITGSLGSGELAGYLKFRDGILQTARDELGRIAIALAGAVNKQHVQGVRSDGSFGGLFFSDINAPDVARQRVTGVRIQSVDDPGILRVDIDDPSELSLSEYDLRFPGPSEGQFFVTRRSDGELVAKGQLTGEYPQSVSFEGLTVTFEDGRFLQGDHYRLQPTRSGAQAISRAISDPGDIALGSPLSVSAHSTNQGTGAISGGQLLDASHPIFSAEGTLTPNLMVRFTSPTTYDVLDNTDPANPVQLSPPLRNLSYVPGIENQILPGLPGQTLVQSSGASIQKLPATAQVSADLSPGSNGYASELLSVSRVDPTSGVVVSESGITLAASSSARLIADQLSALDGVSARGYTELRLTQLQDSGTGQSMAVAVNGERFSFPTGMSLNELADAINASSGMASQKITAASDGTTITLKAATGNDLSIFVAGDPSDRLSIENPQGDTLVLQGQGTGDPAQLTGSQDLSAGYDFSVGGPYDLVLGLNGNLPVSIPLTTSYADGVSLVAGIQSAIDSSAIGPGVLAVSLDGSGQLQLRSIAIGQDSRIELSNATATSLGSALGLVDQAVTGRDDYSTATVGGSVSLTLDPGIALKSKVSSQTGNVFTPEPQAFRADLGFQVSLSGSPKAGDAFNILFNSGGVSDNRNALALTNLQTSKLLAGGQATLTDVYSGLIESVGAETSQARINSRASESLLQQSIGRRESNSGVNLDEEAADLIKFQQAYNASAKVISVARDTFDILFNLVG